MSYHIEVISIGGDFDAEINEAAQILNGVQNTFQFGLPPVYLASWTRSHFKAEQLTSDLFDLLRGYLAHARGGRKFVIGIIDQKLRSSRWSNLFGSHDASKGVAVVTLSDWISFTESARQFLCYYLIRYALSFVNPELLSHPETRNCFFDFKERKSDLQKSLDSGHLCPEHREQIAADFTPEVQLAFERMSGAMRNLREDSTENLQASSLKGHIDVGIITMKPEEYTAVLQRFTRRRTVDGHKSNYSYARVTTKRGEELRVAIGRTVAQAQGAAQGLAASMLTDLNPRWLLVVGIAGGVPASEFSLGDVLVSQRMHDFSVSAANQDAPTEYEDLGGRMADEVVKLVKDLPDWASTLADWSSVTSISRARPRVDIPNDLDAPTLYGPEPWKKKVVAGLTANFGPGMQSRSPIALPATFISSNTLVKDVDLFRSWLLNARQSEAVEMELAGVMEAAHSVGEADTCVLSIRGISDIVGFKRDPEWTQFACHSAAAFAHALIVSGKIHRKK